MAVDVSNLTGAAPRAVNGWTLIATLHHRPGRPTTVQLVGIGELIDIDAWSRSEGWCEHCRTRRLRRTTFLLRRFDGRFAQVGSNCLADFTGHLDAVRLLRPARRARSPRNARTRRDVSEARSPTEYIDTTAYLTHVAHAIMDSGFVPVASATRGLAATWSGALVELNHGRAPSARARRRAQDTLAWVRTELGGHGSLDDFERRLVQVLTRDRLTLRELPTAAAGVYAYHRHLRRQIAAREKAGEYIGAPGEVTTAMLTVRRVERVATSSGPVHRHVMCDQLGRLAIWDTAEQPLSIGPHRLRVAVSAHQRVDRRPATIVERCEAMG
jgi:hypothetical protein